MSLNNTIILPIGNDQQSKNLLSSMNQNGDIVSIIIFGNDANAQDAIQKADFRAGAVVSGIQRKAVWMQNVGLIEFLKTLIQSSGNVNIADIDESTQIGVAVSLTNLLMDLIPINPIPDYTRMEIAFMAASSV